VTAADLLMTIAWFDRAVLANRPAIGDPERITWGDFAGVFWYRREGEKDGPNFVPARFKLEADGRHVRRLTRNLMARTGVALDCEANKETGELPPAINEAVARIKAAGWAAALYTSHRHRPAAPRYRVVSPLSEEIPHELPAPEVVADRLGLRGVLDESKVGASSVFYLPSCECGCQDDHKTVVIEGSPIDATWIRETAGAILAEREAEKVRQAKAAHAEAAARREAKIAAGFDPDASLIEKLRPRFDLDDVLRSHGYDATSGSSRTRRYRHPNSSSGSFGANIKTFGGIPRVFSHNATDPLHASNLPAWCEGVTALDVIDVVTILDFGGDRTCALRELAEHLGISKTAERSELAKLIFRLRRKNASQEAIEEGAYAEGRRLGLSRDEVIEVARWCASRLEAAR
jgi:hypothetical protein